MNTKLYIVTAVVGCALAFSACEKVIDVKLDTGVSQLAVSAFVNNKHETQIIVLSKTAGYFNNVPCPPATGASVKITDNKGNTFNFIDYTNEGRYMWTPAVTDTLAHPGYSYTLSITYGSEQYQAVSIANPVPQIDSMNYELKKGDNPSGPKAYYASFFARDIKGRPDYYWIKSFQDGSLLSPQDVNLSIDGAIGGPGGDGLPFIVPVRQSINPGKGFNLGDTCAVEVHTISADLYFFFLEVQTQTRNGGLFATPPANVSTNIKNVNPASVVKAVGFFNIAMVSNGGIKIK